MKNNPKILACIEVIHDEICSASKTPLDGKEAIQIAIVASQLYSFEYWYKVYFTDDKSSPIERFNKP